MIQVERYGLRSDGNTVVETTTYIESLPDHPLAVEVEGHPGWWIKTMVGNSLLAVSAQPVTKQRFNEANEEMKLRVEAIQEEIEQRRELRRRELEEKQDRIKRELEKLGLSTDTVNAIIQQVKEQ